MSYPAPPPAGWAGPPQDRPYGGTPAYGAPVQGSPAYGSPAYGSPAYGAPIAPYGAPAAAYGAPGHGMPAYGAPIAPYGAPVVSPRVGQVRSTLTVILLNLVTFGLYGVYYHYAVHQEMKDHSGQGLGGVVALLLYLFVPFVLWFTLPGEVAELYRRRGLPAPVSAATGLWVLLGSLIVIGPLVWLVKTNGALNAYWRGIGVR